MTKDTYFPGKSVTPLPVFLSNIPKHSCVLLEPTSKLPSLRLSGAKWIVDTKNNKAFVQIINPTTQSIKHKRTTVIASATIVEPATVFTLDSQTVSKSPSKQSSHEAIPFDLEHSELTDEQQQQLLLIFLNQHRSMFATNLQDLGQANTQPHNIETGDALPFRQRFYRQSPQTNAEMNRQLQEMLDADIIEESDSMQPHKPNSFQL